MVVGNILEVVVVHLIWRLRHFVKARCRIRCHCFRVKRVSRSHVEPAQVYRSAFAYSHIFVRYQRLTTQLVADRRHHGRELTRFHISLNIDFLTLL